MLFREEDEDLVPFPFADRLEAGWVLASKLKTYSDRDDVVVLGLARGGVIVAFVIAGALHAPLDVFMVGKIGTPWNKELAMGAVTGAYRYSIFPSSKKLDITEGEMEEAASAACKEVDSREKFYRRHRLPLELQGKTAILVDDGNATGCTILAAVLAVRRREAARVVVAVPGAPLHGCSAIQMEADDFVTVVQPEHRFAVSQCYLDFNQVSDETVQATLEKSTCVLWQAA